MIALPDALTGDALALIAIEAGAVIDRMYRDGCAVATKADKSPVTEADGAAETIILARLREIAPGLPVIAEEEAAAGRMPAVDRLFALVDPLDGTKEFVSGSGDFTVNIGIIADGDPVMGVVYAPATRRLWVAERGNAWAADVATEGGLPVTRHPVRVRSVPDAGMTAVVSRSHRTPAGIALLEGFSVAETISAGSSLKFCRVAEGAADIYPRAGRTMEWDTAAGHAVLLAAGGVVVTLDGTPLRYGKHERGFDNPGFVALGDPAARSMLPKR